LSVWPLQVNGVDSADVKLGWGPAGGYVYQKSYVEFFCSPDAFKQFAQMVQGHATLTYMAANSAGSFFSDNESTACISWGAFPASEIKQAYVSCANGFKAWSAEAFELWSMWQDVLPADSDARKLLQELKDSWFLVSLVENDYVSGDVYRMFS
jgi:methylenetetrahydrofolate reductase (NADPH)